MQSTFRVVNYVFFFGCQEYQVKGDLAQASWFVGGPLAVSAGIAGSQIEFPCQFR